MRTDIQIENLKCGGCAATIKKGLLAINTVSEVTVDGGRMLKRVQPAPQGRAHRIRKRSNHVTLVVDSRKIEIN